MPDKRIVLYGVDSATNEVVPLLVDATGKIVFSPHTANHFTGIATTGNLDTTLTPGIYYYASTDTNAPSAHAGRLMVWKSSVLGGDYVQFAIEGYDAGLWLAGHVYVRQYDSGMGGGWSPWKRIFTPDNDGHGSDLDADLLDGQQGANYMLKATYDADSNNVVDNADLLDGYHGDVGNTSDTYVRRNASRYIYCGYINCSDIGDPGGVPTAICGVNGNGYIYAFPKSSVLYHNNYVSGLTDTLGNLWGGAYAAPTGIRTFNLNSAGNGSVPTTATYAVILFFGKWAAASDGVYLSIYQGTDTTKTIAQVRPHVANMTMIQQALVPLTNAQFSVQVSTTACTAALMRLAGWA